MTEPRTEAGRSLVQRADDGGWQTWTQDAISLPGLRRLVEDIEAEAVTAALARLREVVEGLPGEECRASDDPEDYICLVHSEVLFDGRCEDYPAEKVAVLRAIDEEANR